MTIIGFALDLVLISLLGTMIFFAVRLHRRLDVLRSGKQDLEHLLRDLVASTSTAERNLKELQVMAEELAPSLQKQVAGARAAREELEFLLGSADTAAERLMTQIGASKQEGRSAVAQTQVAEPSMQREARPTAPILQTVAPAFVQNNQPGDDNRRMAETDLLRAIEKLR